MTARAGCAALLVLATAGCASTTINNAATTLAGGPPPTTVYSAVGAPAELFDRWQVELDALSARLIDNEGGREALARVELLWAALLPTVAAERTELSAGFEAVMTITRTAVERRRPADADKAAKNLRVLVAAFTDS